MNMYTTGYVAKKTGISLMELRRLDSSGLFKPASKTAGGHRRYSKEQLGFLLKNMDNLDDIFYSRFTNLPETAVEITGAVNHWIDIDGSVYCLDTKIDRVRYIRKAFTTNGGYSYCGVIYKISGRNKTVSKRVHRLVAEAFVANPHGYPVVGHKNNIKNDNRADNLYWTTVKENTQKAVDDGLLVNDKGYDDSQSFAVNMYETKTNKLLGKFGSISEAVRETGLSKTTIARQAKYKRPVRKPYYFRYADDASTASSCSYIIGLYELDTNKLLNTFTSINQASKQTGYSHAVIQRSLTSNDKCLISKEQIYFKKIPTTNN